MLNPTIRRGFYIKWTSFHPLALLNTPASEVKVIVGSRNNRDAKNELVQKRPDPSLLVIREKTCK